jgi:hypothetical protein
MRNKIFLLLLTTIPAYLFNSCSKQVYPSGEVNFLSGDEQTVNVSAVGYGKTEGYAIADAEQNAFDVLLFRGLPESKQKMPLIRSDEATERSKKTDYFNQFYGNARYKTFVMSSVPISNAVKIKGGLKRIEMEVRINLSALRRDLETFGIIRKFGY